MSRLLFLLILIIANVSFAQRQSSMEFLVDYNKNLSRDLSNNEFFIIVQPITNRIYKNFEMTIKLPPTVNYYNQKYRKDIKEGGILPWNDKFKFYNEDNELTFKKYAISKISPAFARLFLVPVYKGEGSILVTIKYLDELMREQTEKKEFTINVSDNPHLDIKELKSIIIDMEDNVQRVFPFFEATYSFGGEKYTHRGIIVSPMYNELTIASGYKINDEGYINVENSSEKKEYNIVTGELVLENGKRFNLAEKTLVVKGKIKPDTIKSPSISIEPQIIAKNPSLRLNSMLDINAKLMPSPAIMVPEINRYFYSINLDINIYDYLLSQSLGFHTVTFEFFSNLNKDFGVVYAPEVFLKFWELEIGASLKVGWLYYKNNQMTNEELKVAENRILTLFELNSRVFITKKIYIPLKIIKDLRDDNKDSGYSGFYFGMGYKL